MRSTSDAMALKGCDDLFCPAQPGFDVRGPRSPFEGRFRELRVGFQHRYLFSAHVSHNLPTLFECALVGRREDGFIQSDIKSFVALVQERIVRQVRTGIQERYKEVS